MLGECYEMEGIITSNMEANKFNQVTSMPI